ncbi:MAG TPA: glycosyltransferase family 9 protein [Alphaproteobacteria bacterium]
MSAHRRILVVKLGALGDFILAYRAMAAIRAHHRDAAITLLTIPPLVPLAEACGLFDEVWTDPRPRLHQPRAWVGLLRRLNGGRFTRVYDLQTADRTRLYFRLMGPPFARVRPQWSGHARGASHRHADPGRDRMHTLERQAAQLAIAGIGPEDYPPLDLSWAAADVSRHGLIGQGCPYVLMVPGGSAGHPEKRWPAHRYGALARDLAAEGLRPVVVGAAAEAEACAAVAAAAPETLNLCGDSPLLEVAALARAAAGAVGNDTGPMHLIAAVGCPSLVLHSGATDPALTRPRGPYEGPGARPPPPGAPAETVTVLRRDDLSTLGVAEVRAALFLRRFAGAAAGRP